MALSLLPLKKQCHKHNPNQFNGTDCSMCACSECPMCPVCPYYGCIWVNVLETSQMFCGKSHPNGKSCRQMTLPRLTKHIIRRRLKGMFVEKHLIRILVLFLYVGY